MSIRPKRNPRIKNSQKDSFAWNKAIQGMQETKPDVMVVDDEEELKVAYDKHNIGTCSCDTKTPDWKHHKQYCPIWKNGMLCEFESIARGFVFEYEHGEIVNIDAYYRSLKELLKQK